MSHRNVNLRRGDNLRQQETTDGARTQSAIKSIFRRPVHDGLANGRSKEQNESGKDSNNARGRKYPHLGIVWSTTS